MKHYLILLTFVLSGTLSVAAQEELSPVPFNEVTLNDAFWRPRLVKQKEVLVPFALDKAKPAVDNLRKTAHYLKGVKDELPFPHRYIASDLYKVMEGAAYLLKLERDPALEKQMDNIIDIIADAQQADGYHYESHITGVASQRVDEMGSTPYSYVVHSHELYNMGHMYEAAIAYYQATGKDKWLKVAETNARHINHVFFEGDPAYNNGKPVNQAPGHQEIELALVKLYKVTGNSLYLDMAKRFIDIRGVTYRPEGTGVMSPEYAQQHLPVRQQTKAVGHAVRAAYLYAGMADVSAYTNDRSLRPALDSIWHNIVDTRMHITGGLGAVHGIEGFGPEYELPNKDTYDETCAAVGNVLFNHRMFLMEKDAKYMDVAEVALLNNVLAGVNLEGNRFFYVNPLETDGLSAFNHGLKGRSPWFETACCPSNLARLIPQVPGLMYATTKSEIYCSFYAGSQTTLQLAGGSVALKQETDYPFGEKIVYEVSPEADKQVFSLMLRIPTWSGKQFVPGALYRYAEAQSQAPAWSVKLNGKPIKAEVIKGFATIHRAWKKGDVIELHLPMPVRFSTAIDKVEADRGKVCITRGPLVYCAEGIDNAEALAEAFIPSLSVKPQLGTYTDPILKGIPRISINELTLLPYFAWNNRGDGSMQVWFPRAERNYPNNRFPLLSKAYTELPIGTIKPDGWLEEQLKRMATGMTGHMDSIYPQVMGERNGWLGGDGDVWERGPYWIDGLLPLAYILEDKALIQKVQPWIEWTLASQKPNGYFGPDTDRPHEPGLQRDNAQDWWPKMVVLKIMQQYYSATGDERVIPFLTNYFRYQLEQLPQNPLGKWTFWGERRGGDNLMIVYWLYNITGEKFLLELGELIHRQTFDWTDVFLHRDHLSRQHSLHCVNLAQGFKAPVIYYQQSHAPKHLQAVKKAVRDMRHAIAFPIGLWAGDELLRFANPAQGSELCTAVEMMFSLEKILEITGDVQWADHLERIAYNALPTQTSDDFSTRQYYQQINQVEVSRQQRNFVTPHDDTDNLFGTLTGYPCCTSNLHQGWPKLVQHLWFAAPDNGLAALVYAPSTIRAKVGNGISVTIREETAYPFEEQIRFHFSYADKKVKSASFPFHFRIPAWCPRPVVRLNGQPIPIDTPSGGIARLSREWKQNDILSIELPMEVDITYWYDGAAVIERGPLVYALKMNEHWEKKTIEADKQRQYGASYYEVTSDSPWNYALMASDLRPEAIKTNFVVEKSPTIAPYPWTLQEAPVTIKTKARRMPRWQLYSGSVATIPYFTQQGEVLDEPEPIELIPYGCTTLRITEFPVR